jgi:hypothetical protein
LFFISVDSPTTPVRTFPEQSLGLYTQTSMQRQFLQLNILSHLMIPNYCILNTFKAVQNLKHIHFSSPKPQYMLKNINIILHYMAQQR